ncbi:MAG: DNA repair protein RecO [Candidatus Andersenbacteria bacterium]|nr:DNA repair protein RecO [Candidatus Andersenbacteria bacterium]
MAHSRKVSALVLSRRSVGEADRLVTFFTAEMGLLRVLAKGVRKIPSRRGGHLEPLTQVTAVVSGGPGRYFLTAAETRDYFRALHRSERALASAGVLAWAAAQVLEYEAAYPAVFAVLKQAWQAAPFRSGQSMLLEAVGLLVILRAAGLTPQLAACQRCGERQPVEAVVLNATRGGWQCLSCLPADAGIAGWRNAGASLTPRGLQCVRLAAAAPALAGEAVLWRWPARAGRLAVTADEGQQVQAALRGYMQQLAGVQKSVGVRGTYGIIS